MKKIGVMVFTSAKLLYLIVPINVFNIAGPKMSH